MFQSPFGGISMLLYLLVVMIGKLLRLLTSHSVLARRAISGLFTPFIVRTNDTPLRRVSAFSIPLAIFMLVLGTIISSFVILVKDEERIPAYRIPAQMFEIKNHEGIEKSILPEWYRSFRSNSLFEPEPRIAESENAKRLSTSVPFDSNSPGSIMSTSTIADSVLSLSKNTSSSQALLEFLRDHGIDNSFDNRFAIAAYLGIPNYEGKEAEDVLMLSRLQELLSAQTRAQSPITK